MLQVLQEDLFLHSAGQLQRKDKLYLLENLAELYGTPEGE